MIRLGLGAFLLAMYAITCIVAIADPIDRNARWQPLLTATVTLGLPGVLLATWGASAMLRASGTTLRQRLRSAPRAAGRVLRSFVTSSGFRIACGVLLLFVFGVGGLLILSDPSGFPVRTHVPTAGGFMVGLLVLCWGIGARLKATGTPVAEFLLVVALAVLLVSCLVSVCGILAALPHPKVQTARVLRPGDTIALGEYRALRDKGYELPDVDSLALIGIQDPDTGLPLSPREALRRLPDQVRLEVKVWANLPSGDKMEFAVAKREAADFGVWNGVAIGGCAMVALASGLGAYALIRRGTLVTPKVRKGSTPGGEA